MNPWDILGWILVTLIGVSIVARLLIIGIDIYEKTHRFLRHYIRHLGSRNTPPAAGQYWYGEGFQTYEVTLVHDNGVVGWRSDNVSAGDTPDQWKRRVRSRRLYLGRTR